jgi:hypothetical protein
MESSNLKGAAHVPILALNVDAAKLPSLLLAMPAETGQLALGDGTQRKAPAIVACAYCDGVADLVDAGEIVWRYRCDKCGFEAQYSPAQCAEWLGMKLIRSDRKRLAIPYWTQYEGAPVQHLVPLASYLERGEICVYAIKPFGTNSGKRNITLHDANGKKACEIICRRARSLDDARELVKTCMAQFGDTEQVVYHDPAVESALTTEMWLPRPVVETTEEGLKRVLPQWNNCDGKVTALDGTTKQALLYARNVDVANVAIITARLYKEDYGPNAGPAVIFQREGWTPPAPVHPAEKKGKVKGKKTAAAEEPATVDPDTLLKRWHDVVLDDPQAEEDETKIELLNDLETLVGETIWGLTPEERDALIARCQAAYPGLNPLAHKSEFAEDPDE